MAYRQKVTNPDIRTVTLKDLPKAEATTSAAESPQVETALVTRHPGADMRRIALAAIPLIIILIIGSYLDITRQWVVPLAEWLMRLGS